MTISKTIQRKLLHLSWLLDVLPLPVLYAPRCMDRRWFRMHT
jgi:hypothetical protein